MDQIELEVSSREVLGKKVKLLRRKGITPVHLFGHGIESLTLQCNTSGLHRVLAKAGHTRLVNLKIDSGKESRTVIVRDIQREPRTDETLHVDFYQVKMEEQVRIEVPVVLIGEAPALRQKENTLVHELTTLTIECLPAQIPASVEINIGSLTERDQAIRVGDIALGKDITVVNDAEVVVVRISTRRMEKEEVAVEAEAVAEAGEAEEAAEAAGAPSVSKGESAEK